MDDLFHETLHDANQEIGDQRWCGRIRNVSPEILHIAIDLAHSVAAII